MPIIKNIIAAGLFSLCACVAQAATLTSDFVTVGVSLEPQISNPGLGPQTVAVGDGYDGDFFGSQQFDVNWRGGTSFRLRSTRSFSGGWANGDSVTWTISGLEFSDGEELVDINITRSFGNVTITDLTATSFSFTHDDVGIPSGRYLSFEYITAIPAAIPLPASVTLLLAALCGMGVLSRRRRTRTLALAAA